MNRMLARLFAKTASMLRIPADLDNRLDELTFNQGTILVQLARNQVGQRINEFEFKVFSQWGEDGIIQKLIRHLDIPNKSFIEFGVEDFRESNCRFLLMHDNWRGLVIDACADHIASIRRSPMSWRHDLEAITAFVDVDNINEVLARGRLGEDIDILSIDVDGVDYWVLAAIHSCKPRILIVEYNSLFGVERSISVPYDARFERTKKHFSNLYYGASLAAFHYLATQRSYSLIGTNSAGSNAFFVRDDLLSACPFPALSVRDAFVMSNVRESRDPAGGLSRLAGSDRLDAIRGMPVVNVVTGQTEPL